MKRLILLSVFLCIPLSASATTFQVGNTVEVDTGGNSYAAGSIVQVVDDVQGDVYLAGESVQVNAPVSDDAMLAGDNVTVNGRIGDDLHAFGSTILLNESVQGDVMLFGQRIVVGPDVRIHGSTVIGGENVSAQGRFDEDTRLMGAEITIDGTFLSDVQVHAGNSLEISEDADIRGDLHLSIPESLSVAIPDGVVRGEIQKTFIEKKYDGRQTILGRFKIFSFLSRVLIGAALISLARMFALQYGGNVRKTFWKVLGLGFLGLLVPPIAAVVLFLPVITIPLALIVLVLWGTLLYFSSLLAGLLVANFLFPLLKTDSIWQMIGKFALGTLIIFLVRMVPFIGSPLTFLLFLLSIGSVITYEVGATKALRKAKML